MADPIHQFEIHKIFSLGHIGGQEIAFTNSSAYMFGSVALVALLMIGGSAGRRLVPNRVQSVAELSYEFVGNTLRESVGEEGMKFFPFVFSLFAFILTANLLGLFPLSIIPGQHQFTTTSHFSITGVLAVMSFAIVLIVGFARHRLHFFSLFVPHGTPTQARRLSGVHTLLSAHPDSLMLANYALAKRLVAEMARLCAANGVAFVVLSVPLVYEDDAVAELRAIDPTLDPAFFDRDLGSLADSTGFDFVPLTGPFAESRRRTGQRLHWAHWNYRGHRLVGGLLVGALAALSPPPQAGDNR